MDTRDADVLIVGAGIIGLAHAYIAAKAGKKVLVLERSLGASGASIANFGMLWPIGQTAGRMFDLAIRSRSIPTIPVKRPPTSRRRRRASTTRAAMP